jgi:hypothetical protein
MGGFTDATEDKVMDALLGGTALGQPATYYFGLSTTTITDAGGNITEPSGNNYSRVAITNNKTSFTTSSGGLVQNAIAINFPTASGSWGTIVDWFMSSAASGGTIWFFGTLPASRPVASGDQPYWAALALTFGVN